MASPTQSEYQIGRVGIECASSGKSLAPGDGYVGALIEVEGEEELVRQDFAVDAWSDAKRPGGVFAYWHGVVPDQKSDSLPTLDPSSAADLFDQLESAEDPKRIAFRYLLALMMMRKRLLVHVGTEAGQLLVRRKGDDAELPPMEVAEPELDQAALDELAPLVADLLGIDVGTVAKGRRELLGQDVEVGRIRKPGGGRKPVEKKHRKSSPESGS